MFFLSKACHRPATGWQVKDVLKRCFLLLILFVAYFSHLTLGQERFFFVFEGSKSSYAASAETTSEDKLWEDTISPYLKESLWDLRDSYDAGHHLMVPLHAAFSGKNIRWQQQFNDHFSRFLKAYPAAVESGDKQRLNRLHYFYLVSRYLVLARQTDQEHKTITSQLYAVVYDEIESLWTREPAWQWGRVPFAGGMRERILWKLKTKDVELSYYRAIIDEELFLIAIAADLVTCLSLQGKTPPPVLQEILAIGRRVFENEVVWQQGGGWLFQPGVWTDHPDYAFAGQQSTSRTVKPLPVAGIAWDSSHSHRFPLWLTSLEMAGQPGSQWRALFQRLLRGLEQQLIEKVMVPPDANFNSWRLTNYMDGRNGLYRWRQKDNVGYGPYELSGTFLIGWWSFLDSERIRAVYQEIAACFPLSDNLVALYVGPGTSRPRHPLLTLPVQYRNGFIELLVNLAATLPAMHHDGLVKR